MENPIQLTVVTPDSVVFEAPVEYVGVPGMLGDFGVYQGHATLLSSLRIGSLFYKVEGHTTHIFVSGGFVDVSKSEVTVLAESATPAELIDVDRALRAKERAEALLRDKHDGLDIARAQAALERALHRLRVAATYKS